MSISIFFIFLKSTALVNSSIYVLHGLHCNISGRMDDKKVLYDTDAFYIGVLMRFFL
jgi:hypothetical protein